MPDEKMPFPLRMLLLPAAAIGKSGYSVNTGGQKMPTPRFRSADVGIEALPV
jgi:hypothetical protein